MTEFDDRIRKALDAEYGAEWEKLSGEQRIDEMLLENYRGRNRGMNIMMTVVMLAIFAAFVYCITRYIAAVDTKDVISWAMLSGFAMIAMGMLKLWLWLEMERHATAREIKRLELQLAMLASRLSDQQG